MSLSHADPACPACGGSGQLVHDPWRAVPQRVDTCRCVLDAQRAERAEGLLGEIGLPGDYAAAEIDALHERDGAGTVKVLDRDRGMLVDRDQGDVDRDMKARLRALASRPLDPGASVILTGPPGSGKTYAAAALLREQVRRFGATARYLKAYEYVTAMQPDAVTPEDRRALRAMVRTVGVLLLDDIGVEKGSAATMRELWDVIDTRTKAGLPTVFTSNRSLAAVLGQTRERIAVRERLSPAEREADEIGERIASRLKESRFVLEWPDGMRDYRGEIHRTRESAAKHAFAASRAERIRRHQAELDDTPEAA